MPGVQVAAVLVITEGTAHEEETCYASCLDISVRYSAKHWTANRMSSHLIRVSLHVLRLLNVAVWRARMIGGQSHHLLGTPCMPVIPTLHCRSHCPLRSDLV